MREEKERRRDENKRGRRGKSEGRQRMPLFVNQSAVSERENDKTGGRRSWREGWWWWWGIGEVE